MTLACATCLTVGMGAVASADTVDLGYGLYGSTSPTVKAVEVMRVPTDAKLRNNEQKPYPKSTVSAYATAPMPTVKHVAQAKCHQFFIESSHKTPHDLTIHYVYRLYS